MAFLCPVRIRRNKKKKEGDSGGGSSSLDLSISSSNKGTPPLIGRITGSSSIETLVRVGLEKEAGLSLDSRMIVLHDFIPCVDDELEVKRGDVVSLLYRDNDWAYVLNERWRKNKNEGFIPYSYITPFIESFGDLSMSGRLNKKHPRRSSSHPEHNNETDGDGGTKGHGPPGGPGIGGGDNSRNSSSSGIKDPNSPRESMTPDGLGGRSPVGEDSTKKTENMKSSNLEAFHEPRNSSNNCSIFGSNTEKIGSPTECSTFWTTSNVHPFYKDPSPGRYLVLYTFSARDENDLSVERGELITVLNRDDPDWFWVIRSDCQEGFVPSAFVYPLSQVDTLNPHPEVTGAVSVQQTQAQPISPTETQTFNSSNKTLEASNSPTEGHAVPAPGSGVGHGLGTSNVPVKNEKGSELVMLYDYKAQAADDLSVRRGDWVYADLSNQTVEGWLWAYAPKQRKYGFIPKAYARPPAMTSL